MCQTVHSKGAFSRNHFAKLHDLLLENLHIHNLFESALNSLLMDRPRNFNDLLHDTLEYVRAILREGLHHLHDLFSNLHHPAHVF